MMNELDLAKQAFIAAHGRFLDAQNDRSPARWYAALGETLWWIVALDEHYEALGSGRYKAYRNGDAHGHVIRGLRFARNLAGHMIADLIDDPYGGRFLEGEDRQGVLLGQLAWRRTASLPDPTKEQAVLQKVYETHLAGRPVRYDLRRANYFFVRKSSQLHKAIAD